MREQGNSSTEMLIGFFQRAKDDIRLSSRHISVYAVLFQFFAENNCHNPMLITRKKIMRLSKIKSTATYHKSLAELQEFGYITYCPSFNPGISSAIWLIG
jgi:hypothetical protein